MKYAFALLLAILLCLSAAQSQGVTQPPTPLREERVQDMIDELIFRNPEIAAELYKMDAAVRRIPQAGALDDPELTFKLMEIPGIRFNDAMYANVELMQMIPFPSKLSARRDLATLLAEHAHHDHIEKIVEVVSELKGALAMLEYARESLKITAENRQILTRLLKAGEAAYSVGTSTQQELLRTRIEIAKLTNEEAGEQEQIAIQENMVRRILNRPASQPIGTYTLERPGPLPAVDRLLMVAQQSRAMLIHDSLNVVEKRLNVELMKKEYLPDLKFSVEYVRLPMAMENRWSVSAGITLPFAPWTLAKASSRVQEAEAEQEMLSSMFTASKNMVSSDIRSSYASLTALQAQIRQTRDSILPLMNQSIELLLTDYATGRTSYLMVLDSYRMYNDMKRDLAMATMKYQQKLAALERTIGTTDITLVADQGKEQRP